MPGSLTVGESTLYVAVDLDEVEAFLLGREQELATASVVLAHDMDDDTAEAAIAKMRAGQRLVWDGSPLRAASWRTYAAMSGYFAAVYRLVGTAVHFDAWPDGLRLQYLLADWYPLDREFGRWIACRPPVSVSFERFDVGDVASREAYLETFPHGWMRLEEIDGSLPGVHRLINELAVRLGADGDGPMADVPPGEPLPQTRWYEVTTLDDGSLEGWQLQRALACYQGMCAAARMGRDLVTVGF